MRARRSGKNVQARNKQTAKAIEKAAHGNANLLKHKGHNLPDGTKGKPHYQTDGVRGHTFWGSIGFFAFSLLDPFDLIAGELSDDDMIYFGPGAYSPMVDDYFDSWRPEYIDLWRVKDPC